MYDTQASPEPTSAAQHGSGALWIVLASATLLVVCATAAMVLFTKNHMPVDGRTVLLTGASEGMGRSAARQLAAKGANLILVARNVTKLEEAVAEVQAAAKSPQTQRFRYIAADVSEHDYAERVVAEATVWNGGRAPDIVWCVAGLATPLLWAEARDAVAAARRNMDVNYFGAADMSAAILRAWLAPGDGPAPGPASEPRHLVFTASVLALLGMLGYAPYAPSKWALRGLADTLAQEVLLYPDHPVRVHLVCPGTITSPGLERENRTKPEITMELEKDEPPQTPDAVAQKAIAGLERGNYVVSVSLLGELMRSAAVLGGSPKNNWVVDLLLGWVVSFAYFFILWDMNGKVGAWAKKHGHPSTYGKKD